MNIDIFSNIEFGNIHWWKSTNGKMFMDWPNRITKNNKEYFLKIFGKTYRYIGNQDFFTRQI
jgi:hypothetical protein